MGGEEARDSPRKMRRNHLTLRFKNGKTTILVAALPTDTFTSIKKELLLGLSSAGLSSLNGETIPSDPEQIELALPVDRQDPSQGWVPLALAEPEDDVSVRGSSKSKPDGSLNDTPKAAGLKDGAMLAFRFLPPGQAAGDESEEWNVDIAKLDDAED